MRAEILHTLVLLSFIILGGKIEYRGTGEDQERAMGNAGQKAYLNFIDNKGAIK